jgi:hypothetical protein
MDDRSDIYTTTPARRAPVTVRLPSARAGVALATVTLAIGVVLGAAIGPAPDASFAGGGSGLAKRLPLLIATIRGGQSSAAPSPAGTAAAKAPAIPSEPAPKADPAATPSSTAATGSEEAAPQEEPSTKKGAGTKTKQAKLPAISNVWLIELDGTSFEEAEAQPAATPYITETLLPAATLLKGWSALEASTFAGEATLAEPPAAGAVPPLLHSIVQPPCPEGAPGAGCAPGTPGQLTSADQFLKAVLTPITSTATYREHGLVVVTFTSVGLAGQSELPAGSSTSTLTYRPPAGAVLLSPFAKAGARSSVAFDPTSPRRSLEKLLH